NFNDDWKIEDVQSNKKFTVSIPASIMNTLLENNEIKDPFYRDNEDQALEIAKKDYLFYKNFQVDQELLEHEHIDIKFHGIDTIAEISLNGNIIATTENMHRIYEFNMKPFLVEGENRLEVMLFSPLKYIEERQENDELIGVEHAVEGYQHLRKAHS